MSLLSLPGNVPCFLYTGFADMRKTFEGLCGLVRNQMNKDPVSRQIYIFVNKRGTQVKLLCWEGDGFGIYHKRLEAGTFERPVVHTDAKDISLTRTELQLILQGVKLQSVRFRKRYVQK